MADHMQGEGEPEGPWTGGWLVAGAAGLAAAFLAWVIGDVGLMATFLVAVMVFLVFGVLLGLFWGNPAAGDGHGKDHGHRHDHHAPPAHPTHVAPEASLQPLTPVAPVLVAEPLPPMPPLEDEPPQEPLPSAEPVALAKPAETIATLAEEEPMEPLPGAEPLPGPPIERQKPQALDAARSGMADDLQVIEGIGPSLEQLCHELGIYHFDQIAGWGPAEVAWMDGNLKGFRGRVTRDRWVAQARLIGAVGVKAFLIRAKTNDY